MKQSINGNIEFSVGMIRIRVHEQIDGELLCQLTLEYLTNN